MANWCSTNYIIDGDKNELKSLYELIKPLYDDRKCETWLGDVVSALGKNPEKVSCRGSIEYLDFDGEKITMDTESAWVRCNEVEDLIRERFPHIRIFFYSEELGCEVCETNDQNGIYFDYDPYYLDMGDEIEFHTEEEVCAIITDVTGKKCNSIQEARDIIKRHNDADPDNWIVLMELAYVD